VGEADRSQPGKLSRQPEEIHIKPKPDESPEAEDM
jgi:hypothetical protein